MFKNIINSPNEPKFRQFKITNEAIKSKILAIKGTLELVKAAGFSEFDEEHLAYKDSKVDTLKKAVDIIEVYTKEANEKIKAKENSKKNDNINKLSEDIKKMKLEQDRKKQEILNQIELDKKERAKKEKATDSKANDLKFGATLKKFECKDPKGG